MTERNNVTPAQHPVTVGRGGGVTQSPPFQGGGGTVTHHVPPQAVTPSSNEFHRMAAALEAATDAWARALLEDAEWWLTQRHAEGRHIPPIAGCPRCEP
jgi:hypothetical protein